MVSMGGLAPSYWLFWRGKIKEFWKDKSKNSSSLERRKTGCWRGSYTGVPVFLLLLLSFVDTSDAHGRFIEPPSRVSSWRFGGSSPHHHNDHGTNCGGYKRQWLKNGGRCGVCGDPWDLPQPRDGERGGTFGEGEVVRTYTEGQWANVSAQITANHKGFFEFRLCPQNRTDVAASESCMERHLLDVRGGGKRYMLPSGTGIFSTEIALPKGLTCSHCVLQWRYVGGNNWGICPSTGIGETGCGPQEEFRACSDISITPGGSQKLNSGFFDFNFGNDLNKVGSRWSKPDPLGGERLLHQGGWNPVPAPLQPQPGTSMVQSPALSSWSSPTSLKNPDTPSWMGLRQTYKPITSNQVSVNRMGVISPQWQQPDLMFPSLFAPLRRKSNIYRHRSNSRLRANRRNSFQSRIQSRRHQPLTRRRRPATVVKSLPARKPTSKPKSGWKSWINILWGPKTPIWPLSLLQSQQQQVEPRVQQPDLMFPSLVEPLVEPEQEEEEELASYSEVNYSNRWEGGFSFFSSTRGRKKATPRLNERIFEHG